VTNMIIERVELENFCSFRGHNFLDTTPGESRNVTLIIGHGGAGKTTVGKAIRWCLYNRHFSGSDDEKEYDKEEILKLFHRKGGGAANTPLEELHMTVRLHILPSKSIEPALKNRGYKFGRFNLERTAMVSNSLPTPRDVALSPLSLKGPDQREVADSEGFIDELLLPASASTFFMFHGDRIRDLTKQIDDPIQDAINLILDVTAFQNAESDLGKMTTQFSRALSNMVADKETSRVKQKAHEKFIAEIEKIRILVEEKEEALKKVRRDLKEIEGEQKNLYEIAGLDKEYDAKVEMKNQLQTQLDKVDDQLLSLMDFFPPEVLHHCLAKHARETRQIDSDNRRHEEEIKILRTRMEQLKLLKPGSKCPTCQQAYPSELIQKNEKDKKITEMRIKRELDAIQQLDPEFVKLNQAVMESESIRYDPTSLQDSRGHLRSQIADIENKLGDLRKKLASYGDLKEKARSVELRVRDKAEEEGRLIESLRSANASLKNLDDMKRDLERQIALLVKDENNEIRKYFKLSSSLRDVFSKAVQDLANAKRREIAVETGNMLMKTTIKPDLFNRTDPVEIDKDFQVITKNLNGDVLEWDGNATSEKSLLSLGFIYGLLRASERDAPVILDTFFGNMDPNHIRKITENLASFGSEIILMATLTEFHDLLRNASPALWQHVNRFVFLKTSASTKFATEIMTTTNLEEAEKAANKQEIEFRESVNAK